MKVYVSGPITNVEKCESRFKNAAAYLRNKGHEAINPYTIPAPKKSNGRDDWSYYMRESVKLLAIADQIYMLEGWEDSLGATIEHNLARDINLPIMYEKDDRKYV
tara:strand:- start:840 stop:1154 length:315 start_codon:yes stop_codon:yes gene_type:complete